MNRELYYIVGGWTALVGLVLALSVLVLQFRALRLTGHPSLRLLVASSVLAVLLIPISLALQYTFWLPVANYLYVVLAILATVQAALGVRGTHALLQTFTHLQRAQGVGDT